MPLAVQILALEGVVSAVVGVEKAKEWEVQMLEELGHQVVGRMGNIEVSRRVGKMRRHAVSEIHGT